MCDESEGAIVTELSSLSNDSISQQTFFDLAQLLSPSQPFQAELLKNLRSEQYYLPLISLANRYWLIAALVNKLKPVDLWTHLPPLLQDYLKELEVAYQQRALAIHKEVIFVCELLSKANINVILLKGAASMFNGVSEPISSRYMSDIDLLLPEHQLQKSIAILSREGYYSDDDEFPISAHQHHHAPALIRKDGPCYIELHHMALSLSASAVLTNNEIWQDAQTVKLNKTINVQQLSPTQQVIQCIAHSELSDKGYYDKHIDLRQLLTVCSIATHYQSQIDWSLVETHFARIDCLPLLHATLYKAFRLYHLLTPITREQDKEAHEHFLTCIDEFLKRQSKPPKLPYLRTVLEGYRRTSIVNLYGNDGPFAVLKGRLKHLRRHLQMLAKPKYVKRFIRRNLDK